MQDIGIVCMPISSAHRQHTIWPYDFKNIGTYMQDICANLDRDLFSFVTRNADEGAGVSRWRHPFNLDRRTTPESGDSRVNISDAS